MLSRWLALSGELVFTFERPVGRILTSSMAFSILFDFYDGVYSRYPFLVSILIVDCQAVRGRGEFLAMSPDQLL